jgi:hypothetical protein
MLTCRDLRRLGTRPQTLPVIGDQKSLRLWIIYGRKLGEFAVCDTHPHLDDLWTQRRLSELSAPAPNPSLSAACAEKRPWIVNEPAEILATKELTDLGLH